MADQQVRILFSEAHGERLRVDNPEARLSCTRWVEALKSKPGFGVDPGKEALTQQVLSRYAILVLGAPMGRLSQAEVDAITDLVRRGGGLLLINDAEAVRSPDQNLNGLGRVLPCQFREYLNAFPTSVDEFRPHYVTAGLTLLTVAANCRLVPSSEKVRPLAVISATGKSLALCGDTDGGRVIAVADSAPFADQHWEMASNSLFAVQCCAWLARQNSVDLYDVTVDSPIELGRAGTLALTLANPRSKPLRRVQCVLEPNTNMAVMEGVREVHIVPPTEGIRLQWILEPHALGPHHLRLTVEVPAVSDHTPLLFNHVAGFMCVAPVTLKLEIADEKGQPKTAFRTGQRFRVEGTAEWLSADIRQDLPLALRVPDEVEVLQREVFGNAVRWYLQGNHRATTTSRWLFPRQTRV